VQIRVKKIYFFREDSINFLHKKSASLKALYSLSRNKECYNLHKEGTVYFKVSVTHKTQKKEEEKDASYS